MFLTVHATVGALIGQHANSAILAFILGFLSHFILDIIPHGDHLLCEKFKKREKIKRLVAYATVDSIIMATFILFLYTQDIFTHPVIVAFGIIGGILPDLFVGIYELTGAKFLEKFERFHFLNHHFLKKTIPFHYGLVLQILFWLIIRTRL